MRSVRLGPLAVALAVMLVAMGLVSCSDDPASPPEGAEFYRIAFVSDRDGNSEIYVVNSDGTGQRRLTDNSSDDRAFAWSPDGSRIVFLSDRTGVYELYMMRPDGSFQTRLTTSTHLGGEMEAVPAWSPDGSQIAFCSGRDGDKEIYVMNADGSDQRNVTRAPDREDYDPAWRPDGLMITYVSADRTPPNMYEIRSVNTDGTVWEFEGGSSDPKSTPCWAPVGTSYAWQEHDLHDVLVVCRIEGNSRSCDGTTIGHLSSLAWSPDGSTLLFDRGDENARDTYRLDAMTMSETRLTVSPAGAESCFPAWSPDGAEIVFASNESGTYDICVMKADGTGKRRLTDSAGEDAFPAAAVKRD